MRARRQFDPKDANRVLEYLAARVIEARAASDDLLVLDVGKICEEAGVNGETAYVVCCDILDSQRFARSHALWYHHRTGAWGTEEARYTFLLDSGIRAVAGRSGGSLRAGLQTILLVLIAVAIGGIFAVCVWLLTG